MLYFTLYWVNVNMCKVLWIKAIHLPYTTMIYFCEWLERCRES